MTYNEFKTEYKKLFLDYMNVEHKVTVQTNLGPVVTLGGGAQELDLLLNLEESHPAFTAKIETHAEWVSMFPSSATQDPNNFQTGR
jgi:hypothetical protein|tara:strand:- start:590 stop:847 length:258 start_codon:yes stop_codon:yes gene_type:complete